MIVKGKEGLTKYKYIAAFDLASKTTGVVLFDIQLGKPIRHDIIQVPATAELWTAALRQLIDSWFNTLGVDFFDIMVCFEAMPQQMGKFTTVQTFLALAKAHAVLETYCWEHSLAVYDWVGIYPISCRSLYKKILQQDKVDKKDVSAFLCAKYQLNATEWTLDETDALSLIDTLLVRKWNADIDELLRLQRKHLKELQANRAIEKVRLEMNYLESLKIGGDAENGKDNRL